MTVDSQLQLRQLVFLGKLALLLRRLLLVCDEHPEWNSNVKAAVGRVAEAADSAILPSEESREAFRQAFHMLVLFHDQGAPLGFKTSQVREQAKRSLEVVHEAAEAMQPRTLQGKADALLVLLKLAQDLEEELTGPANYRHLLNPFVPLVGESVTGLERLVSSAALNRYVRVGGRATDGIDVCITGDGMLEAERLTHGPADRAHTVAGHQGETGATSQADPSRVGAEPNAVANAMTKPEGDPKNVFIIHGRNLAAKNAVEQFVRALGLEPVDFEEVAADLGAAFIGEIVRAGMKRARGIIALFTADEVAFLRPEHHQGRDTKEDMERWQSRPNVIFEAGMAYGSAPERTILAVLGGQTKLFSDVNGMHLVFLSNNIDARKRLRQKLIGAKCAVNERSDAWTDPSRSGDFDSCVLGEAETTSPFRPPAPTGGGPPTISESDPR